MRKRIKVVVVLAVVLWAAVYMIIGNPMVAYHNQKLKKAMTSIEAESVTLNEIVPFDWDRVYTFDPYTSRAEIEETIGFKSRSIQETISEGMVQLLFVKGQSVAASVCGYADNLGYQVDFTDSVAREDEAVFTVTRNAGIVVLTKEEKENRK